MTQRIELPAGWIEAKASDVCEIEMGQSPPSSTYNENGEGLPFFQGKAEFGELYPEIRKWCSSPVKVANKKDVLLSVRAPVGPTNFAPEKCCIGRGLAALSPKNGISSRYVLYAMRFLVEGLVRQSTGSTFDAITKNIVVNFSIPLAPTSEQQRIVSKIEELFSKLDAGISALERAKANLKRYRASVLKSAVEGKLTEAWRAENPDHEPASKLLERILAERRQRWEQEQLANYKEKDKKPPKNWKNKYKVPVKPDTANLPELPEGWCWATLEQVLSRSEYGTSVKCSYKKTEVPVLRIPNIKDGRIDLRDLKYSTKKLPLDQENALQVGDLLICRTNGSISLIGKVALVENDLPSLFAFASYLLRFRFVISDILSKWAMLCLSSHQGRVFIESNAASSAGQHNISLSLMHGMKIPLPPLEEQAEIVNMIDEKTSVIDNEFLIAENCVGKASALRQAILKQAFEGRLVPQDPNDEPAEKLLERIQAERKKAGNTAKTRIRKTRRKTSKGGQTEIAERL